MSPLPRAARMSDVVGFGIDRVAAAAAFPHRGRRVLRLENLDTDLPLPPEAVAVTREALTEPASNSWLPFTGDLDLRAAIADDTAARCGHPYDPEREIVVTCGGMEALLDVLLATVDAGNEVVLTDPIYAGIVNRVRLAGGRPVFARLIAEPGGWRLDREALAAAAGRPRARVIVLMSPSMPTGHVLDRDDWALVAELCERHDLLLLYDAAMEALRFDGRELVHPLTLPGMTERTVIAGSLSKEHRMIGWRVGWIAGPEAVVRDAGWVHVYNTTMPVAVARRAATAVLRGDHGHVARAAAELQRRRDAILATLPHLAVIPAHGGWSLLVDTRASGLEPAEASRIMMEEGAIAATPMTGWGENVAARHLRLVFSAEPVEALEELGERLAGTPLGA